MAQMTVQEIQEAIRLAAAAGETLIVENLKKQLQALSVNS